MECSLDNITTCSTTASVDARFVRSRSTRPRARADADSLISLARAHHAHSLVVFAR